MGVRVRLSRNTSACFPFWVAIPVWLCWLLVMTVVITVVSLVKLLVYACAGIEKGITALQARHHAKQALTTK
jgi:hypothetical protein